MTEFIFCAGGNAKYAKTAISYGWTYGAQMPSTVYYKPEFIDQNWKNPKRETYMQRLALHKPRIATVLDLEHEDQFDEVMSWAEEASQHVTESVIIIPKATGIIDRIPETINGKRIILGYSVPTSHGGTYVPLWEFGNRPVHLLGGSAMRQLPLFKYLNVVSLDNNNNTRIAMSYVKYFANGHFYYIRESIMNTLPTDDEPLTCFKLSLMNMNAYRAGFGGMVRFAVETDIPTIKKIASQHSNQLGFVNSASLKDSVNRCSLIVATLNDMIVGFANYRTRRDGVSVIYELGVNRNHYRQRVGSALLASVPRPTRLKVTVDNLTAVTFYEANGFTITATEQGRKRMLHVMERGV